MAYAMPHNPDNPGLVAEEPSALLVMIYNALIPKTINQPLMVPVQAQRVEAVARVRVPQKKWRLERIPIQISDLRWVGCADLKS